MNRTTHVAEATLHYEKRTTMNDLPAGYKRTEVGVIPEDWEVVRLKSIIKSLQAGVSVNSDDKDRLTNEPSILKTSSVVDGKFYSIEKKKIIPKDIQRARINPKKNTIILSRMNTPELVGECGYVRYDFPSLFLPDRLWLMEPEDSHNISMEWLSYLLSSKQYKSLLKSIATGTSGSMKNISKDSLLSLEIPYPEVEEQRAIATALTDVDALLTALEKLIAKKREIKTAAMQQLLTGKTRLPGFSGEWETKRLGNISKMSSGGTPPTSNPHYFGGSVPWVSISDMTNVTKYLDQTEKTLTENGLNNSAAKIFPPGTVLYAMYASIGECAIAKTTLATSQAILGIQVDNFKLNNEYLYYYLKHIKKNVMLMGQQGTQNNLNKGIVENFLIPLPSIVEQTAIAQLLSDMDAEIDALEKRLEKTRVIKEGMIQELLTGRVRLNNQGGKYV